MAMAEMLAAFGKASDFSNNRCRRVSRVVASGMPAAVVGAATGAAVIGWTGAWLGGFTRAGASAACKDVPLKSVEASNSNAAVAAVAVGAMGTEVSWERPFDRPCLNSVAPRANSKAVRRRVSSRSTGCGMSTGCNRCEPWTGPLHPKLTERQVHSGSPGPVWIRALTSCRRFSNDACDCAGAAWESDGLEAAEANP